MLTIAQRIKAIRKARKLSQKDFAQNLGVNQGHISRVETETANPSKQLLKSICREFKVREEWLLEGKTILDDEGLTPQEIVQFEINIEKTSKEGLFNYLTGFSQLIGVMADHFYEVEFAYKEVGEPNNDLLEAKQDLEYAIDIFKDQLSSLFDTLTKREKEVFAYVIKGYLNKQIAYELALSEKTVKIHRSRVMQKMKVDSLPDLVLAGHRLKLSDLKI